MINPESINSKLRRASYAVRGAIVDRAAQLEAEGRSFDRDLLLDMHRTLSRLLMESGNIERAEGHLMKAMKLEMPNVDVAINKIGAEKRNQ